MVALMLEVVFSKDSGVTPMMLVKIIGKKTWSSEAQNKLFLEVLEASLDRIKYWILSSYDLLRMMHADST